MASKKASDESDSKPASLKCSVCDSAYTPVSYVQPGAEDQLCWVCRRLKISAWRDSDLQPQVAQE